jgi:outer membrane receptor protein involved in Fe transport
MRHFTASVLPGERRCFAVVALVIALVSASLGSAAQTKTPQRFNIAAGAAEVALKQFSTQSGRPVIVPTSLIEGVRTRTVTGEFTAQAALDRMLASTGLVAQLDETSGAFAIVRGTPSLPPTPAVVAPRLAPKPPAPPVPKVRVPIAPETIELSPFVVSDAKDVGYLAANTLAGSRLNTPLKDTAASITVMTEEFLHDLGTNDITDALLFANNLQVDRDDAGNFGDNPGGNPIPEFYTTYRVRGLPATVTRNYFKWLLPSDSYNVERLEDSRGPNAVLFGLGSPGGIINVATKRARFGRESFNLGLGAGSYGSRRATLDYNRPLLDNRLALRVNLLADRAESYRRHAFNDNTRGHLNLKYRPFAKTEFRADWEFGMSSENVARPTPVFEGSSAWMAAGRPTFATVQDANAQLGISRLAATRNYIFTENTGGLMSWANTNSTNSTFGIPNATITSPTLPVLDTSLVDPSVNLTPPGPNRHSHFKTYSLVVEQQLSAKTFVEAGFAHQDYTFQVFDVGNANLRGDPNRFLPSGAPNPFVGRLYVESWGSQRNRFESSDTGRITFTTELELGKWGRYRASAYGEYEKRRYIKDDPREIIASALGAATPEASNFRVTRRHYVTEGQWGTWYLPGAHQGLLQGVRDPVTGESVSTILINATTSTEDDPSVQQALLFGLQGSYFGGRLVASTGLRRDKVETYDRGYRRNATTHVWEVDYGNAAITRASAQSVTLGVVGHVTKNISLLYNQSSNNAVPNTQIKVYAGNGSNKSVSAPVSQGEGRDMGVALDLFGGKVYTRAVYFTTSGKKLSTFRFGNTSNHPAAFTEFIFAAAQNAGLITQAEHDEKRPQQGGGVVFDRESKGYEFSITANPMRNLRFTANYSYTKAVEDNIAPEIVSWWEKDGPYYKAFPQDLITTNGNNTIRQVIANFESYYQNQLSAQGVDTVGSRPHKASFVSRYGFAEGRLKGAYVGLGYRWQSRLLGGRETVSQKLQWLPTSDSANLFLGYDVPRSWVRNRHLNLQLNIDNLQDRGIYRISRLNATEPFVVRSVDVIPPRTWRFSSSLSF